MSFDRLAPHYGWMEWILAGNKLHRMRTHWLAGLPSPRRALLAGEGGGRFLVELRRRAPESEIVCLDASERMLSVASRRLERSGLSSNRVRFIHAELPHAGLPHDAFDLIVTHFFLDCFPPAVLGAVIRSLSASATGEAHWLLSDFRVPDSGFPRQRARGIHAVMYAFFRATARLPAKRLTAPDPLLMAERFSLSSRHVADWGLLHSDWWQRRALTGGGFTPPSTDPRES